MTTRIQFEEWQLLAPVIAFGLTFVAFIYFSIRAFMMKKPERDRLSHLPLKIDREEMDHFSPKIDREGISRQ